MASKKDEAIVEALDKVILLAKKSAIADFWAVGKNDEEADSRAEEAGIDLQEAKAELLSLLEI